jgi:hypothetical protein
MLIDKLYKNRYHRANDQDIFINTELSYENFVKVAHAIHKLKWTGPVICMTDCTKIKPKIAYSSELGCIVGSTLSYNEAQVNNYQDISTLIQKIKDNNQIATQVRVIALKVHTYL